MNAAVKLTTNNQEWGEIETRWDLNERLFREYYVRRGIPVLVKNFAKNIRGLDRWDFDYLKENMAGTELPLKRFSPNGDIQTEKQEAGSYIDSVMRYEDQLRLGAKGEQRPAYCHDVPVFSMVKKLIDDVRDIPKGFFPKWYQEKWWNYAQFFMSSSDSCTPLHYDTLLTHNLFIQVKGKKEFILLPFTESKYCYRRDWRWYGVDPVNADLEKYPFYKDAAAARVVVEAGDLLFMPSGTLHHVTTKEASISFNVDFHTTKSVIRSFGSAFDGMPIKNVYYNFIVMLGLVLKIPDKMIFRFYRSYLNYIS